MNNNRALWYWSTINNSSLNKHLLSKYNYNTDSHNTSNCTNKRKGNEQACRMCECVYVCECVRMCVCVCEGEREKEQRDSKMMEVFTSVGEVQDCKTRQRDMRSPMEDVFTFLWLQDGSEQRYFLAICAFKVCVHVYVKTRGCVRVWVSERDRGKGAEGRERTHLLSLYRSETCKTCGMRT